MVLAMCRFTMYWLKRHWSRIAVFVGRLFTMIWQVIRQWPWRLVSVLFRMCRVNDELIDEIAPLLGVFIRLLIIEVNFWPINMITLGFVVLFRDLLVDDADRVLGQRLLHGVVLGVDVYFSQVIDHHSLLEKYLTYKFTTLCPLLLTLSSLSLCMCPLDFHWLFHLDILKVHLISSLFDIEK